MALNENFATALLGDSMMDCIFAIVGFATFGFIGRLRKNQRLFLKRRKRMDLEGINEQSINEGYLRILEKFSGA